MSTGIIDQITLECLMNKDIYNKIMAHKTLVTKKNQDKEFYHNRILHLFEQLMTNTQPEGLMQDVTYAFENYVKTCIRYFKIIDESDIIQQDYNGSPSKHHSTLECLEESNNELEDEDELEYEDEEDNESEEGDNESDEDEDELEDEDEDNESEDDELDDEEVSEHCVGKKEEPYELASAHKSRYFNEDALCAIISEDEEDSDEIKEPKTEVKEVKEEKKAPNNQANVLAPIALKGRLDIFMRGGKQEQAPRNKPVKEIVPKVKDINLENPELKNKGIGNKWKEKNW